MRDVPTYLRSKRIIPEHAPWVVERKSAAGDSFASSHSPSCQLYDSKLINPHHRRRLLRSSCLTTMNQVSEDFRQHEMGLADERRMNGDLVKCQRQPLSLRA